jgi:hypothetical protein
VNQSVDGLVELRLDQTTHFQNVCGDGVEFGIELAGDVFIGHGVLL